MIISVLMVIIFIVLAVIFLMGKGDKLIAGYNTASEEERKIVNISRLRIIMAIVSGITAIFCLVQPFLPPDPQLHFASGFIFVLVMMVFIVFANTWTKKK